MPKPIRLFAWLLASLVLIAVGFTGSGAARKEVAAAQLPTQAAVSVSAAADSPLLTATASQGCTATVRCALDGRVLSCSAGVGGTCSSGIESCGGGTRKFIVCNGVKRTCPCFRPADCGGGAKLCITPDSCDECSCSFGSPTCVNNQCLCQ